MPAAPATPSEATESTGIVKSIDRFTQGRRRRTVTVIISDLFDPDPELMQTFQRLAARRHDASVLHLIDPAELEFPYESPATFTSLEDQRRLFVHPRTLRATFVEEMRRFIDNTARVLSEAGIDYHCVDTREEPRRVLGEFLRSRERRR